MDRSWALLLAAIVAGFVAGLAIGGACGFITQGAIVVAGVVVVWAYEWRRIRG
jgi:hypothetical protein